MRHTVVNSINIAYVLAFIHIDFLDILDIFLNQRKIVVFEEGLNAYNIVFRVDDNASKDLTKIESILDSK